MKNYDKKFLKISREPLIEDFFVSKKGKTEQLMGKKHKEVTTFTQQMLAEADRRQQMIGKVVMCSYCGEVFVAILGASQLTYVEAVPSQKLEEFISACENALYYFGGAPSAIVPDNLKSAVIKSHRYEPKLNENFEAFIGK